MNLFDFTVKDIDGNDFKLSQLKGKKILVVNTASECGLTPQYEILESLYQENEHNDFVMLAFLPIILVRKNPAQTQKLNSFAV